MKKSRPPKDTRTEAEKREQGLRDSAAIRGISYEEMLRLANGGSK
jgi:hypothetical protein